MLFTTCTPRPLLESLTISFQCCKGVRQGCNLSHYLFSLNIKNVEIFLIPNHSDAFCNWKCILLLFADVLSFSASGRFIPWATEIIYFNHARSGQSALANHALYTLGDMKHCTNMKHNVFHSYLLTSSVSQRILLDELGWQVSATEN